MRLRRTPILVAAAATTTRAVRGWGGIETIMPHSGAVVSYLGGTTSPLDGHYTNSLETETSS